MFAYKVKSRIDKRGNLSIHNLPFKNKESVEIIILINDHKQEYMSINQKINRLSASFGTISSEAILDDDVLRRENLYEIDGR
jgi:hypothetical protein